MGTIPGPYYQWTRDRDSMGNFISTVGKEEDENDSLSQQKGTPRVFETEVRLDKITSPSSVPSYHHSISREKGDP